MQLLYYIALSSMSRGSFWGPHWDVNSPNTTEFYDCIKEILEYSGRWEYCNHPFWDRWWIQLFQDCEGKKGIRIKNNQSNLLEPLLYVIENYDTILSLPEIFENSEFQNIKIRVEISY